jgi:hypothetical protein
MIDSNAATTTTINTNKPLEEQASDLTPKAQIELARIDKDVYKDVSADASPLAELRSKLSFWKKIGLVCASLLALSLVGNFGLTFAGFSKDLKVEGGSLQTMDGASVSTHNKKSVYEVTLVSHHQLDEQAATIISEHSSNSSRLYEHSIVVAQVSCANVLLAISSIENGDDEGLVKMSMEDGGVWEPRLSAASYHFRAESFVMEQLYLDGQRDVPYDVICELSKESCESAPNSLCDGVERMTIGGLLAHDNRRALSIDEAFDEGFDGEVAGDAVNRRRLYSCNKFSHFRPEDAQVKHVDGHAWHYDKISYYLPIWHYCGGSRGSETVYPQGRAEKEQYDAVTYGR